MFLLANTGWREDIFWFSCFRIFFFFFTFSVTFSVFRRKLYVLYHFGVSVLFLTNFELFLTVFEILEKLRNPIWRSAMTAAQKSWHHSHLMWRHHLILLTSKERVWDEYAPCKFHCHSFHARDVVRGDSQSTRRDKIMSNPNVAETWISILKLTSRLEICPLRSFHNFLFW